MTTALGVLLAGSFLIAGVAKLRDRRPFAVTLAALGAPAALSWVLPVAEIALAVALLAGGGRVAAVVALVLLAAFTVALRRLGRVPCRCFGAGADGDPRMGQVRNALLAAAAVVLVVAPAPPLWEVSTGTLLVLACVVIALLVAVVLRLLRQLGALRALIGADASRTYDDVAPVRLYDPVEPFAATALDGTPLTIGGEGPPTLLVFHQPHCVDCQEIPAALEDLESEAQVVSVVALDRSAARATPGVPTIVLDDLPPELRPPATPATIGIAGEGLVCVLGRAVNAEQLREAAQATASAAVMAGPGSQRLTDWGVCAPFFSRAGAAP